MQQLKLPTVSELATSVAEANAALSYQLKRIANLEAELKTVTAERDAALSTRDQERLAAQSAISDFETQVTVAGPHLLWGVVRGGPGGALFAPTCTTAAACR
eukprot:6660730-Prymnesium_polylepis.1